MPSVARVADARSRPTRRLLRGTAGSADRVPALCTGDIILYPWIACWTAIALGGPPTAGSFVAAHDVTMQRRWIDDQRVCCKKPGLQARGVHSTGLALRAEHLGSSIHGDDDRTGAPLTARHKHALATSMSLQPFRKVEFATRDWLHM